MPDIDLYKSREANLESPAQRAAEVTPNDAANIAVSSRCLYIGTSGDIRITTVGGDVVNMVGVSGFLPLCVLKIHATGTTASDIVALW